MKILNKVSDSDFENAWASIDNQRMMRSVARNYRDFVTGDDADQLMRIALHKTLQSHDHESRRKFITSLRLRTVWEFKTNARTEFRKRRLRNKICNEPPNDTSYKSDEVRSDMKDVVERLLSSLEPDEALVIGQYYMDDCSLAEISRRTGLSRTRVDQLNQSGMLKLKYLIHNEEIAMSTIKAFNRPTVSGYGTFQPPTTPDTPPAREPEVAESKVEEVVEAKPEAAVPAKPALEQGGQDKPADATPANPNPKKAAK